MLLTRFSRFVAPRAFLNAVCLRMCDYCPETLQSLRQNTENLFWKCSGFLRALGLMFFLVLPLSQLLMAQDKIDHRKLTHYLNDEGEAVPIRSMDDWKKRRASVLQSMQQVTGTHPGRRTNFPLQVQVLEEVVEKAYRRQKITLDSGDGDRIPALLYLPNDANPNEKRPGIVALHPTGAAGKLIVDGSTERENRQYARELAERGYVVVAPDYISFGDYEYDFEEDKYQSGTMKGIVNHQRCLDLLQSLPEVDADRLGVIGHSLGGHNAIFLAVFDNRVKVVVASCGWTPFHDYYEGKLAGWTSDRYMPLIRDRYELDPDQVPFDFPELIATLAPRPFLSISPLHDSNFEVSGVRQGMQNARPIYELYQASEQLKLLTPDCAHDFPPELREAAYRFMDDALKLGPK